MNTEVSKVLPTHLLFKRDVGSITKERDIGGAVKARNAWMDEATNMKWVNKVLIPGISDKKNENVLLADNVSFQLLEGFHQVCRKKANMIVYMLPPSQTDKVQPIDQGEGYLMKKKIGECLDSWLEDEKNLEEWNSTISAKKRRVLLTRWVGEAWQDLNQKDASTRRKFF